MGTLAMQAARVLSRSMATAPVAQTAFYNCLVVGSGAPAGTMAAALAASGKSVGVIDPVGTIAYSGAFPLVATSGAEEPLAAAYGDAIPDATAIVSSAKTFSPESNTVTTADGKTIGYKYLILAPEQDVLLGSVKGLAAALEDPSSGVVSSYNASTAEASGAAHNALSGGNVIYTSPSTPTADAAAPFLGERAFANGAIGNATRADVNVVFNTAASSIAPDGDVSSSLGAVAEERGITVNTGYNLVEVDANTKEAIFDIGGGNLQVYDFDLLHVTPPTAPGSMKGTPFADANGVIAVEETLQTKFDNVFAIGPCTSSSECTVYGLGAQAAAVVENIDATEAGHDRVAASGYSAFPIVTDFNAVTFAESTPALSGLNVMAKLPLVSPETIGAYVHFDYLSNGGFADGGASSYPAWSKDIFIDRDLKLSKAWQNLPGDV